MQQDSGAVGEVSGGTGREDRSVEERIVARAREEKERGTAAEEITILEVADRQDLPAWVTPRFARTIVLVFCLALVGVSIFQATDNYYAHRAQARQGAILHDQSRELTDLSDRIHEDDKFFDAVRELILLGPDASPAQRQAIIDELKREDAARQAARAQETTPLPSPPRGKVSGGSSSPGSPPPSQAPTTTSTTSPSPSQPPSPPPSSPPPAAQACVNGTCITTPPLPTIPHSTTRSSGKR